jgi:hypothetical protein
MAREPAERYQSVAELRAALARFAERIPTSASLEIGCEAIAGAPRAAWTIGALFVMLLLALGLWRKLARESVSSLSPAPLASAPHPVALAPSAAAADASPANISVPARAEPTAVVSSHPDERPRKRPASNAIAVDSRHPASSALSASPSAPGTTTLPFDRNNPYSH